MPSVTSYRPCRAQSCPCRHRLGLAVSGQAPDRNAYASLSHTTRPSAVRTIPGSRQATNPRSASSKSVVSSNGRVAMGSLRLVGGGGSGRDPDLAARLRDLVAGPGRLRVVGRWGLGGGGGP